MEFDIVMLKRLVAEGRLQFFVDGDSLYCTDTETHETVIVGTQNRHQRLRQFLKDIGCDANERQV